LSFQFGFLNIKRLIVHQVFIRSEDRQMQPPRFNNVLTNLNPEGLQLLQARVVNALGDDSHSIEMEIANVSDSSIFSISANMIYNNDEEFISNSKIITTNLAEAQLSRNIPAGIVVIFDGTIGEDSHKFLCIIKAEMHGGFYLEDSDQEQFGLKYLQKLLLTPQQKLYKIGMFIEKNVPAEFAAPRNVDDFQVFVFDQNMSGAEMSKAALYFYETFLGCTISPSNKKLTRDFYINTKDYINSLDIDDETKVDLNTALYTYLKTSQSNTISISDFSAQYMTPESRDEYNTFMASKGFPCNAIPKDTTLIKSRLQKRRLRFTSNVNIEAPSEQFGELVEVIGYQDNKTTLRIQGRIKEQ
jgi:nucleoid-associated protein YejK